MRLQVATVAELQGVHSPTGPSDTNACQTTTWVQTTLQDPDPEDPFVPTAFNELGLFFFATSFSGSKGWSSSSS